MDGEKSEAWIFCRAHETVYGVIGPIAIQDLGSSFTKVSASIDLQEGRVRAGARACTGGV